MAVACAGPQGVPYQQGRADDKAARRCGKPAPLGQQYRDNPREKNPIERPGTTN